tara:strand:- start:2348 stop:4141 length:1794 start_codon:yes stop_codon:yes gene_type:complete
MAVSTTVQIRAEDRTKQAFRNITERTNRLKSSFGGLATMAVGLAGTMGIGALMGSLRDLGDRIGKVSTQIGISAENLQKLQFSAEQSGLSTDTLNTAMQKFAINIGKANDGAKIQMEAFQDLGVETKNLDGTTKSVFELFKDTSDQLGSLTDKTLQARLASELFGRTGVEMTVLFNEGAEGIERYGRQLSSVNGIMGGESINAIQRFNDSWNLMTKAVRGFLMDSSTLNLLSDIIDGWTFGIQKLNEKFGEQEKKVRDINEISADLALARKETLLFQTQIEESTGKEQIEAIKRLKTNQEQIKELQTELLSSKKIETNVVKQQKAQKQVKKGIEETNKVAKQLVKTTKPLMIGGKLNIPAIGGRKGLGGTLEKFTKFYLNLMKLAEDYLGSGFGVSAIVKKHLAIIRQDFSEMITGLENQLVFRRNDISNAFSDLLNDIQRQIETKQITVNFDASKIEGAQRKLTSLVNQINGYSAGSRTVTRGAGVYLTNAVQPNDPYHTNIYWEDEWPRAKDETMAFDSDLSYQVPTINSGSSSSRQSGGGYSGGSSAMSNQGSGVVVNVFDGTGQKISEYDSSIRIQINERANRYNKFPALPVS